MMPKLHFKHNAIRSVFYLILCNKQKESILNQFVRQDCSSRCHRRHFYFLEVSFATLVETSFPADDLSIITGQAPLPGACGRPYHPATDLAVGVSQEFWTATASVAQEPLCEPNVCVIVSSRSGAEIVRLPVRDKCAGTCAVGQLALSVPAYTRILTVKAEEIRSGRIVPTSWKFGKCDPNIPRGYATFYVPPNPITCEGITINGQTDAMVAVPARFWDLLTEKQQRINLCSGNLCIKITTSEGRTATVVAKDRCAACEVHQLQATAAVFTGLGITVPTDSAAVAALRISHINWMFVTCDPTSQSPKGTFAAAQNLASNLAQRASSLAASLNPFASRQPSATAPQTTAPENASQQQSSNAGGP